jgi:hypothetical protein
LGLTLVKGVLPVALRAKAAIVEGLQVIPVQNLREAATTSCCRLLIVNKTALFLR